MSSPTSVDRQSNAGNGSGCITCKEDGKFSDLFDRGETLVRLLCEQHVPDHLITGNPVRLGLAIDLCLDQRSADIAWTDRVAGRPP